MKPKKTTTKQRKLPLRDNLMHLAGIMYSEGKPNSESLLLLATDELDSLNREICRLKTIPSNDTEEYNTGVEKFNEAIDYNPNIVSEHAALTKERDGLRKCLAILEEVFRVDGGPWKSSIQTLAKIKEEYDIEQEKP